MSKTNATGTSVQIIERTRVSHPLLFSLLFSLAMASTILPSMAAADSKTAAALPSLQSEKQTKPELKLPPYRKVVLANGVTILLMERHNLPIVNFSVIVKAGSVNDPAGCEGTAMLTAELLRRGTESRSATEYAASLDFLGGSFQDNVQKDYSVFSSEFMKKDLEKGLALLSDPLLHPTFPEAELNKSVARHIDEVRSGKDQANRVLRTYFESYLMGTHPYARPVYGDELSLARIKQDQILSFYKKNYTPENTIIAAVGDFNSAEMEKQLTAEFGSWHCDHVNAPKEYAETMLHPLSSKGKRLLFIDKPDSTQTYFCIGNVGISRTNPDRVAIQVVNAIFGGRFTSMLNSALRIKSGLTYGARSVFEDRKCDGPVYITTYTRNATTEKAIDMALEVLKQLHEKGISEEQLAPAKAYLKGQAPQRIETDASLANVIAELEFHGLDRHDIDDLYTKIDATSMADTKRIISQYYPLDDLVFVVIGKGNEIGNVIKKYASKEDTLSITDKGYWPAASSK